MLASSSCFLFVEYVEDLVVEEDGSLEQSEVVVMMLEAGREKEETKVWVSV